MTTPQFSLNQKVYFTEWIGTIKSYRDDSGEWIYTVEITLGSESDIDKTGSHTTILVHESDMNLIFSQ
ncbi:MAG: hypothetical protein AB4426_25845 [Xenococcaceae cyanobacterium]